MSAWYECKVAYQKVLENGKSAKMNEVYLVDAVSFTEAETRIYKELSELLGDFSLKTVKRASITELVHNEEADKWYKVKVSLITYDEKSGKERKSNQIILTSAENLREAFDSVTDLFSGSISDHEIIEIVSTPIVEIFPFYLEKSSPATIEVDHDSKKMVIDETENI